MIAATNQRRSPKKNRAATLINTITVTIMERRK